uniref:Fe2OG dioxygenase domain-containing protein n=1 Tax=Leersia perrieri TaxID=77586 RepID=A0A0D9WMH2_9ORYZ
MVHPAQAQKVQHLAAGDLAMPPSRYVQSENKRPTAGSMAVTAIIPTIDMNLLTDAAATTAADEEATKLRSALQSWGLFAVTGHGMPESFLDEILSATRNFFHLPPAAKEKYSNVVAGAVAGNGNEKSFQAEGYGIDRIDTDEQILDWCDRLYLQVQPESNRQLKFWPPELHELLEEYTLRSEHVFRRLLAAVARNLGFNSEFFADKIGDNVSTYARFTYYPPCPQPELVYGLKPHTDNSVLTILLLDNRVGGLQILRDGRWLDIPVLTDGELLVIAGDEIEIMSNGVFMAPVHRVVASDRERISVVMFYQPEPEKVLAPSEELVGKERPAMYKRIEAKVFGDGVWDAFAAGERTIDFLKVKVEQQEERGTLDGSYSVGTRY